ncbi:hypothetical protein ACHAXR_001539 [Thalassiosira sp. AJA248-18]
MAAVAPAAPAPIAEPTTKEEADMAPLDESDPMDADDDHLDEDDGDEHEDDGDEADEHENEVKEWDEGGKSHCGYGDSVHETLMSIGASIHKVVGEPNDGVQGAMQSIGNWFQEASYAARDMKRGNMDVAEEAASAMKSVVSNDDEEDKEGEGDGDVDLQMPITESAEEGGGGGVADKLSPVKEASSKAEADAEANASA